MICSRSFQQINKKIPNMLVFSFLYRIFYIYIYIFLNVFLIDIYKQMIRRTD